MNRAVGAVAVIAIATLADYCAWIAWAQTRTLQPDGLYSDPYQPWQIIGLVIGVIAIAAIGGWYDRVGATIFTVTTVLTLSFSLDWATDPPAYNDGLWGVGATLVAIATFAGVAVVARMFRPKRDNRLHRARLP